MANVPESATYDAGVYQLEIADPVQGGADGASNSPLKNLANRTKYLKQHVDALETAAEGFAPLSSPALTNSPTAPTQALGDNSTKIATDAFVLATVGGRLVKSVAGNTNVTLTAVEAGNAILEFSGVLTGSIAVIVPTSPTRSWIVKNGTGGAYTVTVKTASGTGVVCTQSKTAVVFSDGTNVHDALTDFDSPVMTGDPTAPTAAQFDADESVATTAFVQRALGNKAGITGFSVNTTLAATDVGKLIVPTGGANITCVLPPTAGLSKGATVEFCSAMASGYTTTISPASGTISIPGGTAVASTSIGVADTAVFSWNLSTWVLVGGTALLRYSSVFGSSLGSSGYQKLPNGLIIQWGTFSSTGQWTFPISFPNNIFSVVGIAAQAAMVDAMSLSAIPNLGSATFLSQAAGTAYGIAIGN